MLDQLLRQDLDHGLGGQLVHGVVLVVAAGQVGELLPSQLVDALDNLKKLEKKSVVTLIPDLFFFPKNPSILIFFLPSRCVEILFLTSI